jgi:DNA-binding transcriptional LysR family regulator
MDRLSAMEAFVRVIETGSFSGAARQLRIGQPAVSKAIAQIVISIGDAADISIGDLDGLW